MTALTPVAKPVSQLWLAPGSHVSIPGVSWLEFEAILQELGDHRAARVAYFQGTLDIMVPLPEHEIPCDLIADIVKTLLKSQGIRFQPFGSTTFRKAGIAGVEPDACFYIANAQRMIGRRRLQPGDPPPDLAIETDVTSKTTLGAYEAISVPELWIFDSGCLSIYILVGGHYQDVATSPTFPDIPLKTWVPETVERSWQVGSSQALAELEAQLKAD
jgi:Uma2 family endonuclease